jgi:hypothetical protein
LSIFADFVEGLTITSRLIKFIFRFVTMVAKLTRSGRRTIVHLANNNQKLIEIANSSKKLEFLDFWLLHNSIYKVGKCRH